VHGGELAVGVPMASGSDGLVTFRFSTTDFPERDRLAMWRELLGRKMLRVDMEPLPDIPARFDLTLLKTPGVGIIAADVGPASFTRTRELIADGNDDYVLAIPRRGGTGIVRGRGNEVLVGPGHAILRPWGEITTFINPSPMQFVGVSIPRAALAPLVRNVDDVCMRLIPANHEALRLLTSYVNALAGDHALTSPELRRLVVAHVYDLVALGLGATRDAAVLAEGRGLRTARLREALAAIEAGFADPAFSPDDLARRLGVSARYIQNLLHDTGASFTTRVLELRLQRARVMLADPRHDRLKVADIAQACGFNEIPYFNRCFRRRFGSSPTQFRGSGGASG
jgi:AraC-like DNA-binding protein